MKLLNSDKIVDFIDKHSKAIDEDYEKTYTLDQIQEYLDAMPADYDVDSVVAELEAEKEIHTKHYNISFYKDYPEVKQRYEQIQLVIDDAIAKVRKGGVK